MVFPSNGPTNWAALKAPTNSVSSVFRGGSSTESGGFPESGSGLVGVGQFSSVGIKWTTTGPSTVELFPAWMCPIVNPPLPLSGLAFFTSRSNVIQPCALGLFMKNNPDVVMFELTPSPGWKSFAPANKSASAAGIFAVAMSSMSNCGGKASSLETGNGTSVGPGHSPGVLDSV